MDDDICRAFRTPVRLVERELITRPRDESPEEAAARRKAGHPAPMVSYVVSRAVRLASGDDDGEDG